MSEHHFLIPKSTALNLLRSGAVIACPVLGTDKFIDFCKKRNLSINRERLFRLERLGLFSPIFRLKTPNENASSFNIPLRENNNWFDKGWAWDTNNVEQQYLVPHHKDQTQEAYYSIFQIDYMNMVLSLMNYHLSMDGFLDNNGETNQIEWEKKGKT